MQGAGSEAESEARAREPRHWLALPVAAALAYGVLALHAARVETPTVDEFAHVPAGVAAWRQDRMELYRSNPPLTKLLLAAPIALDPSVTDPPVRETPLLWGPWEYGHRFMNANHERYLSLMFRARWVSVAFGLLAGLLVFRWARDAFGLRAAAAVTALYFLCPNVLAHGHLATIDMAASCTILLAVFTLRWAYRAPGAVRLAGAGAALGLALATKFTAVLLLPVFAVLAVTERWRQGRGSRSVRPLYAAADVVWMLAAALLVVNASVAFESAFEPIGTMPLRSAFMTALQQAVPDGLPVPLPIQYVLGFDAAKEISEHGEFGSYLLGRWSAGGWWYYNLVAAAVKLPTLVLLLMLAAAPCWWWSGLARREALYLAVPLLTVIGAFSVASNLNIGIRHVLPALPFAFLALSPIFTPKQGRARDLLSRGVLCLALAVSIVNVATLHPNYLTFFNALAGGPARGGEWLIDSNLDWGQDLYRVPGAVAALSPDETPYLLYFGHVDPALYGLRYRLLPATPVEGIVAVSENFLRGSSYLTVDPSGRMTGVAGDRAAWLLSREPVAQLGSIRLYDTRRR